MRTTQILYYLFQSLLFSHSMVGGDVGRKQFISLFFRSCSGVLLCIGSRLYISNIKSLTAPRLKCLRHTPNHTVSFLQK